MESEFLLNIGLLIKKHRALKEISQEELAYRIGITKNGLGKIELGRSNVKIITLAAIFKELEIQFNILDKIATINY